MCIASQSLPIVFDGAGVVPRTIGFGSRSNITLFHGLSLWTQATLSGVKSVPVIG